MSSHEKIDDMLKRLRRPDAASPDTSPNLNRPKLQLSLCEKSERKSRPNALKLNAAKGHQVESDTKLREIMKISGVLTISDKKYETDIRDMELLEELGHGTCGHVYKMSHRSSGAVIAVKQMRRSGNAEENKRIIMDIEVILNSHDCRYIVQCLGCFITEAEVWICMELMATCFDKLLKRVNAPLPEDILGKVTVATVEALSYLKDRHGVMHRDVKPSNILLDERGNVKLCDFGISGRLVDSMAKTRSAGCAAYMAPERIEPQNPDNPDYDVRADVWSLGITLVELATAAFPYRDCKTDFEVLAKVINQDPPRLPPNQGFSAEFQDFVSCCLKKEHHLRPKYKELKKHAFFKKYETSDVSVGDWYKRAIEEADKSADRAYFVKSSIRNLFASSQRPAPAAAVHHHPPPPLDRYALKRPDYPLPLPAAPQKRCFSANSSPLPIRQSYDPEKMFPPNGSTTPIVLQRFYHQQKQQQMAKEAEQEAKLNPGRRLTAYIKLQLNGDRGGGGGGVRPMSRHQSPEPPPRLNRDSPVASRKAAQPNSPSLSRRYVSPTPPVPPPRRLSESASTPASPQHFRARLHYTPEPHRRFFS